MAKIRIEPDNLGWQSVAVPNSGHSLVLSDAVIKARRQELREERKQDLGRLFSNWEHNQYNLAKGTLERSPRRVSHKALKIIARQCLIDQSIFSAIIQAMQRFATICHVPGKQIGFRVVHKDSLNSEFQPDKEELARIRERCEKMERLLLNLTSGTMQTFSSFISGVTDDGLSIDRKVMIKMLDSRGKPKSYHWLPGETVRPLIEYLRPFMQDWGPKDPSMWDPNRAAVRRSYELYSMNVRDTNGKIIDLEGKSYVQIIEDDQIVAAWDDKEVSVDIVRPYNEIDQMMYGFSPLEASVDASVLWMQAWEYQKQLFSVTYPDALLILRGDYSEEGLQAFNNQLLASYGNSHRLPVIAGGSMEQGLEAQLVELRKTPQEMLFAELLKFIIAMKCSFYRVHPSLINMSSDAGPAENALPQERNYVVQEAYEEGIKARMDRFADWITQNLIQPHFDDLAMIWEGMDLLTEEGRINQAKELTELGIISINDARATMDKPQWPDGVPGENYGEWPASATTVQIVGTIAANKAQEQQAGMQSNPPGLSQPAGSGGGDFGPGQSLPGGGPPPAPKLPDPNQVAKESPLPEGN